MLIGWLNSYHTFSFASYYDPKFSSFHSLRVINEDRVSPSQGFPTHPHSNAEIFSYIVNGKLSHRDSMGNHEVLTRGDLQFTSAGRGIQHSEFNGSDKELVHFIQIWVLPEKSGLTPNYQTIHVEEKDKLNKFALMVAPVGYVPVSTDTIASSPTAECKDKDDKKVTPFAHKKFASINQDIRMYASILQPDQTITFTLPAGRVGYIHLIQDAKTMTSEHGQSKLIVNDSLLSGGDGAYVTSKNNDGSSTITFTGRGTNGANAEFLLFDIKPTNNFVDNGDASDDDY